MLSMNWVSCTHPPGFLKCSASTRTTSAAKVEALNAAQKRKGRIIDDTGVKDRWDNQPATANSLGKNHQVAPHIRTVFDSCRRSKQTSERAPNSQLPSAFASNLNSLSLLHFATGFFASFHPLNPEFK